MSWFGDLFKGFGSVAKDVFVVGTLNGLVLEAKAGIDKQKGLTVDEKNAAKLGVDLLADRVRAALAK